MVILLVRSTITKFHRINGLNNRICILIILEKVWDQGVSRISFPDALSPFDLCIAIFSHVFAWFLSKTVCVLTSSSYKDTSDNRLLGASQVALVVKNLSTNTGDARRCRFDLWLGKVLWRRKWQPTPVFLPGKFHGQMSLAGYSSWPCKELDATEHAQKHKHVFARDLNRGISDYGPF